METDGPPRISVFSHFEGDEMSVTWLEEKANEALPRCLQSVGGEPPLLADLEEVEVSLVSDEIIARVHGDFMDDPTPTDVITFHHGEILVSIDTARREGPFHGNSTDEEALLYIIHGMLHLNGYTDSSDTERELMHECQDRILREVLNRRRDKED